MSKPPDILSISAVTLFTADMVLAVEFYCALGFEVVYGGSASAFTSFRAGSGFINLAAGAPPATQWGRAIVYVSDVDAMYECATANGYTAETTPRDAEWGERYFHIRDPDQNELSFARPLGRAS